MFFHHRSEGVHPRPGCSFGCSHSSAEVWRPAVFSLVFAAGVWFGVALLAAEPGHPAGAWREDSAHFRLRVTPAAGRAHALRVDVPLPLSREVRSVRAYRADGSAVPAALTAFEGSVCSVELLVPSSRRRGAKGSSGAPAIDVYLFQGPRGETDAKPASPARRPVLFHRLVRFMTTRPFTSAEMLRTLSAFSILGRDYSYGIDNLGSVFNKPTWQAPPERRTALLHWGACIPLADKTRLAFGSDQPHVAWFVLVDGEPAAYWRTAAEAPGKTFLGESRVLGPGLHFLDFFVYQRHGEPLPGFMMKEGDNDQPPAPISPERLLPVRHPRTVLVQEKAPGGPGQERGVSWQGAKVLRFTATDRFATLFRAVDPGAPKVSQQADIRCPGASPLGDGTWVSPGRWIPATVFPGGEGKPPERRFPARLIWEPVIQQAVRLRLDRLPTVLPAGADLTGAVSVVTDIEEGNELLLKGLSVTCEALDSSGDVLWSQRIGTCAEGRAFAFQVPCPPAARSLRLGCSFGGVPAARPVTIRLVRPAGVPADLSAQGEMLFAGSDPAVLVCDPIAALVRGLPGDVPRVGLLDDYIAFAGGPEADLLPETLMPSTGGENPVMGPVIRRSVRSGGRAFGTLAHLLKFPAFFALLDMAPDAVVLGVGAADLRNGLTPREFCLHLLFLSQAAARRGVLPIPVALPAMPGIDPADSREAALLVKELAWRLGVPVLDLFSLDKLSRPVSRAFGRTFVTHDGRISLRTPNNVGRAWAATRIRNELSQIFAARNCD